jgi:hypothetical protein
MPAHVLVVATVTATSDDLMAALATRAAESPARFTLLMPASEPGLAGRQAATPHLAAALQRWREAGIDADGFVGSNEPMDALMEICTPGRFDEVIISTLPGQSSRWLRSDLPYRIASYTDLPVTHVSSRPHARDLHGAPPVRRRRSALSLLNVMGYSNARR